MFVPFLYELRDRGVRVGAQEALSLAQALALELHRGILDGFYEVARALCVHREQDLDAFDRAFAHHFRGVPDEALALTDELLEWLEQPVARLRPRRSAGRAGYRDHHRQDRAQCRRAGDRATASASVESARAVAPRRRRVDGSARARLRTALLRRQARHPLQGAAHLLLP